ncbi:MarR family winged helix-turn-helix transcriptional regulator [Staphylococcus warneri]|uniref:Transcriptional regulator n=1 Tax=Staphylococcus warneri TaxID=1292 RepID=A0A8B2ZM65_STAWA|nr:MarR family transcriptional regulator [Staphylococcus warneri]KKI60419.1 Teicoplanin-resistance associated HTH-type transcriptional regulator TcaR [Staphylococcus warneri]MCK6088544.1 MarR family transcriptional regulator [Staphylococcus warneri]MCK6166972.1 MarR family transcriptional regulator [Staphylococcus warneri]MCK6176688.1 MarR family transcriptional regulator [Staphylococcus warneri]MCK6244729.1 MarR family transcriptional regulator [Staphylococcus warneri]
MTRQLEDHIAFLEMFINNVNTLTAKLLKDLQNEYGISVEQSNVLAMLNNESMTISQITEKQGVNKAAVSRRINKLLDAGLVVLEKPNANIDQRLKFITLSKKGKSYMEKRKTLINDIAMDFTKDFSSEDLDQVRHVLEVINYRMTNYSSKLS